MFKTNKISLVVLWFVLFTGVSGFSQFGGFYSNDWENLKLKGLNLKRLEVPNGWLVREGLGKMAMMESGSHMMIFMPDPGHQWRDSLEKKWETIKLKGLNLYRLPVPQGWLVREGWGKLSTNDSETHMIVFMPDPEHKWKVEKR